MKDPGNYKFAHSGPQIIGTIPTGKVDPLPSYLTGTNDYVTCSSCGEEVTLAK